MRPNSTRARAPTAHRFVRRLTLRIGVRRLLSGTALSPDTRARVLQNTPDLARSRCWRNQPGDEERLRGVERLGWQALVTAGVDVHPLVRGANGVVEGENHVALDELVV